MAKKATSTRPDKAPARSAKSAKTPVSTPVRNSATPEGQFVVKPTLTHEMIARRAFEIHCSGTSGSELDDWLRAERELRHELGIHDPHGSAGDDPSDSP
jgi:hypothetical protein